MTRPELTPERIAQLRERIAAVHADLGEVLAPSQLGVHRDPVEEWALGKVEWLLGELSHSLDTVTAQQVELAAARRVCEKAGDVLKQLNDETYEPDFEGLLHAFNHWQSRMHHAVQGEGDEG